MMRANTFWLSVAFSVLTGADWIDPFATAREGARAYEQGDFSKAVEKYHHALVDDPDSALLHFNLGASQYREKSYQEAAAAFLAAGGTEPAAGAFNLGNALFRLGETDEKDDAAKAIESYTAALVAYRRAMGENPADMDAKFNHEVTERKIAELREKQEQEQQQQEEQQESDSDSQPGGDGSESEPSQDPGEQGGQQEKDQETEQGGDSTEAPDNAGAEASDEEASPEEPESKDHASDENGSGQSGAQAGEPADPREREPGAVASGDQGQDGQMSEREAQALLDAARDQEIDPAEMTRRRAGAEVLEPAEDW